MRKKRERESGKRCLADRARKRKKGTENDLDSRRYLRKKGEREKRRYTEREWLTERTRKIKKFERKIERDWRETEIEREKGREREKEEERERERERKR